MFKKSGLIVATLSAAIALSVSATGAHEGATGIVKERMDVMVHVGSTMKLLSGMANGSVPYDAAKATAATKKISEEMKGFADKFPEGSDKKPSEAGPKIWTNNADFRKIAVQLQKAAATASNSFSADGGQTSAEVALKGMGATCKACHSDYRVKR